jgi:N-acetyl-anhydromuramyl-L-alanine amidase AmpD
VPNGVRYPRPPYPIIDKDTYRLPNNQYVSESVEKTGVVLHHTVSRNVQSVYDWWLEKAPREVLRVGTAYVIGTDGTIYEFFPEDCWAWHLGKGNGTLNEMRTIGIEIVSEGPLEKIGDEYYSVLGQRLHNPLCAVDLGKTWRGWRYFDQYDDPQIYSLICLLYDICERHGINKQIHADLWTYDENIKTFEGIYTHAQVRPDKTDVHPLFPLDQVVKYVGLKPI